MRPFVICGPITFIEGLLTVAAESFNPDRLHDVHTCSMPFTFTSFFEDTPWLNVPQERNAILIPPLYPRGGLLGGASDGAPKVSKLQALAVARKKAQEQRSSGNTGVEQQHTAGVTIDESKLKSGLESRISQKPISRGFPLRKRKDSNPHQPAPKGPPIEQKPENDSDISMDVTPVDQVEPSAFANTMFGSSSQASTRLFPSNLFSLPYTTTSASNTTDPFAGPSPDDVVIAAQSKGSTSSSRPKN